MRINPYVSDSRFKFFFCGAFARTCCTILQSKFKVVFGRAAFRVNLSMKHRAFRMNISDRAFNSRRRRGGGYTFFV